MRNRLMHDGLSFTTEEAIQRHAGQAAGVTKKFNALSEEQKKRLLAFLETLGSLKYQRRPDDQLHDGA